MIVVGVTSGNRAGKGGGNPYNLLTDWTTPPTHGAWANDPDWTAPSDAGAVSSWRNGGSIGTPDFTQGTADNQPVFDEVNATYGNVSTVYFGGDDILISDIANSSQPFWFVVVGNVSNTASHERIIGLGASNNRGIGRSDAGAWVARWATNQVAGTADGDPHLFVGYANGASSTLTIDGTGVIAADAGSWTPLLLSIGGGCTTTESHGLYITGDVHCVLLFTSDPTAQSEWSDFIDYVENTVGIAVA